MPRFLYLAIICSFQNFDIRVTFGIVSSKTNANKSNASNAIYLLVMSQNPHFTMLMPQFRSDTRKSEHLSLLHKSRIMMNFIFLFLFYLLVLGFKS